MGMPTPDVRDSEFARCVEVWCVSETIEPTSDLSHKEWLAESDLTRNLKMSVQWTKRQNVRKSMQLWLPITNKEKCV